ncbi:MAG: TatD family hydrolase [Candidatus Hermodarchaeota archaeon]|nr:TatD family hydrolase [Candidatus Hermodarchaeota archaeon]
MRFFDTHSHLEMARLYPKAEAIVRRAREAGVIGVVVSAVEPKYYPKALDLQKRFSGFIWPTFGLHPPRATPQMVKRAIGAIYDYAEDIVAIGEVGLDYYWVKGAKEREYQKSVFIEFIHLADELNLPLVVHSREAEADAMQILREEKMFDVQLHCFNDPEHVQQAAEERFFMSVPTSVVSRQRMQRIAKAMPLENMLLETDAPYLSPVPGQTNEPSNLPLAAAKIAELKGSTTEVIASTTTTNALNFLHLQHAYQE